MANELVVLVNEQDEVVGTINKALVHTRRTPLHRGLSVYVFNREGKIGVQQRALEKKTWPGVWSNSCCGHPLPGETYETAAIRKVKEELGMEVTKVEKVADYRYWFERKGIVENEICPVFRCVVAGEVKLDPAEINDWKWMDWKEWMKVLETDKPGEEGKWSEWCKEEVKLFNDTYVTG